jgi:hypothetical protein
MLSSRLFCVGLTVALICGVVASGQRTASVASQQLYLLSGTPTNSGPQTFPVALYQVGPNGKLKVVREVVPQTEGLFEVEAAGGVLFVLHPHILPKSVSIIHLDNPDRPDDVIFNPSASIVIDRGVVFAEPPGSQPDELIPMVPNAANPNGTLAVVSSETSGTASRVRRDAWDEYAALRVDGDMGGPSVLAGITGRAVDGNLTISIFGHTISVDTLPPTLVGTKSILTIAASSQQYSLLLQVASSMADIFSRDSMQVFVHDRGRNVWKTMNLEGNDSSITLFGPWLASRFGILSFSAKPVPGRDSERNFGTNRLPNVRDEYEDPAQPGLWRSGTLILYNLADDRKIKIDTGEEDSEILTVRGDTVLYRINDTIYQARIVGNALQGASVLVKDDDVPEIHWVFWGSQTEAKAR